MDILDRYIEKLKKSKDVMSISEVEALINKSTPSGKYKHFQFYAAIAGLAIVAATAVILSTSRDNPKISEDNVLINAPMQHEEVTGKPDTRLESTDIKQSSTPKQQLLDSATDQAPKRQQEKRRPKVQHIKEAAIELSPSMIASPLLQDSILTNDNLYPPDMPVITIPDEPASDKYIVLTNEELEKFNIYIHDDVLLFSNTDSKGNGYEWWSSSLKTSYAGMQGIPLSKQYLDQQPLMVCIPQWKGSMMESRIKGDTNWADYLPLKVEPDSGIHAFSVWWFKKTEENIAKLPLRYRSSHNQYVVDKKTVFAEEVPARPKIASKRPAQTKLYHDVQMVEADNELLKLLHIKINEKEDEVKYRKGLSYYRRKSNNTSVHTYTSQKKRYFRNTPPSFISAQDSFLTQVTAFIGSKEYQLNTLQSFHAKKLTMVAVKVAELNGKEVMFWYEDKKRLLKAIDHNQRESIQAYLDYIDSLYIAKPLAKKIDRSTTQLEKMKTFLSLKPLALNTLHLDDDDLSRLNISADSDQISLTVHSATFGMEYIFKKDFTSPRIFRNEHSQGSENAIHPLFVTDIYGKLHRLQLGKPANGGEVDLQQLIPVFVGTQEEYHLSEYLMDKYHPDCLFWFEPTDEFLAFLPDSTAEQIRYELALMSKIRTKDTVAITPTLPQKSCVYLNPCEEMDSRLTTINVFPNPTSGKITLHINGEWASVDVVISSLSGNVLMEYAMDESKKLDIDLSHLPEGIYLLTAVSGDGRKVTRRVVKE